MNMRKKIFCLLLCAVMLSSFLPTVALADGNTYQLATLLAAGTIKPLGRTAVNPGNTGIMCDWPGNGFQMDVEGAGGTLTIGVSCNYAANWAVLVDGQQVYWQRLSKGNQQISTTIAAGSHTVTVVKESDCTGKAGDYCDLTTMTFGGTISRTQDKGLLIEFIGDSYTAGWGTLGTYAPDYQWVGEEHSFTHGYAYYTAQNLNADYTIAARGGIGLFDGVSAEQPEDDPDATIADIYPYTAGFRTDAGLYDFADKADIVVIELGANDSLKETDANFTAAKWKAALEAMTDTVRAKYPNAAIVFLSHKAEKLVLMKQICQERAETDPNLYYFSFAHQGNGSGSSTQYYGHPNAADSKNLADALSAFIRERGLVSETREESSCTDYIYYVSASGNDTNDGLKEGTAKLTLKGALAQARADRTYVAGERIVINVTGTVNINPDSDPALANVGNITLADGTDVPILVQTNNYSGTKAVLDTNHKPTSTGASACLVYFCHSMTLKNITFQSTTGTSVKARDYQLYAGYNHIQLDNVTFKHAGATPSSNNGWYVIASSNAPTGVGNNSTVTFRNGSYTNIYTTNAYGADTSGSPAAKDHSKVIIEEGAVMNNVYNRRGEMVLASSTVEVRGGSIQNYYGTHNNDSSDSYRDYKGDINFVMSGGVVTNFHATKAGTSSKPKTVDGNVNFTMSGGDILVSEFSTVGSYCTVTGTVTNTVSGGIIQVNVAASGSNLIFGGNAHTTLQDVTNNISGGMFFLVFDANVNAGIYLGGMSNCYMEGKLINNISGGSFLPYDGATAAKNARMILGVYSGALDGGIENNIAGGTFDVSKVTNGGIRVGTYDSNIACPKVVNVLGDKTTGKGPMFLGCDLYLAGTAASIGASQTPTAMPGVSECTDTVVLSNTIYSGYIEKNLYLGPTSPEADDKFHFIKGSVENNIYGGQLKGTVYCAGYADVYGKVATNLYGGCIGNLYAGGRKATIYDGVELYIRDVEEYFNVPSNRQAWHFWGGAENADIPAPQTAGRPSIKVTIDPENENDLTLYTPVTASCKTGSALGGVSVCVTGGIFPEGFGIDGVTVKDALAENCVCVDTATGKELTVAADATRTGDASVAVMSNALAEDPATGTKYQDLQTAVNALAQKGGTVRLRKNATVTELAVNSNVTLDLNGCQLATDYFTCFGNVKDGSAGGEALLKAENITIEGDDSFMPIYDTNAGGYRFYAYEVKNLNPKTLSDTKLQFGMRLNFANEDAYDVLNSSTDPKLQVVVRFNWTGAAKPLDYQLEQDFLQEYARLVAADIAATGTTKKAIAFTVSGLERLEDPATVSMTPMAISTTSFRGTGVEKSWSGPAN